MPHSSLDDSMLLQVLGNKEHSLLNAGLLRVDVDLCVLWCFIWSTDTSELLDLASSRLLVQALRVTLLSFLNGNVNEHLDEWEG